MPCFLEDTWPNDGFITFLTFCHTLYFLTFAFYLSSAWVYKHFRNIFCNSRLAMFIERVVFTDSCIDVCIFSRKVNSFKYDDCQTCELLKKTRRIEKYCKLATFRMLSKHGGRYKYPDELQTALFNTL